MEDSKQTPTPEPSWRIILASAVIGLAVAFVGLLFSGLCGSWFNGMEYGDAVTLGMGLYLCVVVVTCTGILLARGRRS